MRHYERELARALRLAEALADPVRTQNSRERWLRALGWQETDRPPLMIQLPSVTCLPPPWNEFAPVPYRDAFRNPAAMMLSQLIQSVVPGLLLGDDSALTIRANLGTIQVASALGAHWTQREDDFPWVEPVNPGQLQRILDGDLAVTPQSGVLNQTCEMMCFFQRQLAGYPALRECVCVALPDLQGPLDTAEQIRGSELFPEFLEEPEKVAVLLQRVVDATWQMAGWLRPLTRDPLLPQITSQHNYFVPGTILLRCDTAMMLSARMYAQQVRPFDAMLLERCGGGSIHSCGDFSHLIPEMLEIRALKGLDCGESRRMDIHRIHRQCREQGAALTRVVVSRDELLSGQAANEFPSGAGLLYEAADWEDATAVAAARLRA